MPVRITKPAINIREKLSELDRPVGITGDALLATDTPQQAFSLIGAGRKNRVINGDMQIDQRNSGSALTGITGGGVYAVDRFVTYNQSSGNYTAQQVSDGPPGFRNSLRVTVATAASTATASWVSFILHYIEGFNVADLNGGTSAPSTVTLSFWVKSSVAGIMPLCINNGATRQYNTTYTINVANTWEKKFVTLTLDTSGTWNSTNGRGLGIAWGLGSGSSFTNSTLSTLNTWQGESPLPNFYYSTSNSVQFGTNLNATFQLTGVQLEEGRVATPFEFIHYQQELSLCKRYYERGYFNPTTFADQFGNATWQGFFEVEKRATGTLNYDDGQGNSSRIARWFTNAYATNVQPTGLSTDSNKGFSGYIGSLSAGTLVKVGFHWQQNSEL